MATINPIMPIFGIPVAIVVYCFSIALTDDKCQ